MVLSSNVHGYIHTYRSLALIGTFGCVVQDKLYYLIELFNNLIE